MTPRLPQGRYPIAIDASDGELLAAQMAAASGRTCIRALFRQDLEPEDAADPDPEAGPDRHGLKNALKQLKKTRGFSGRRVVIHIPMEKVLSFPVDVRVQKEQDLDPAILTEAEKRLPYTLAEAVVDYPSVFPSGPEGGQTAIVTAARRQDVLDLIRPYKTAGFLVDAVDFRPLSLTRLHGFLTRRSDTTDLICHIGRRQSSLQVAARDRIYALSKFRWGLENLTDRLNKALNLEPAKKDAAGFLQTYGFGDGAIGEENARIAGVVSRMLTPSMEELVFEFHKIMGYARAREQFQHLERVYFYGLGTAVKGLFQYIEKRFNIVAVQGDVRLDMARKGTPLDLDTATRGVFNSVIGLALRRVPWR